MPYNQVRQVVQAIHPLSESDWDDFSGVWQPFPAWRKTILTSAGETENYLYFVVRGVSWNIAQCLGHLNSYGQYYLPLLHEKLESQELSDKVNTYKSSWLGRYLIKITDPDTGRKKLKAVKRHQPAKEMDAHQIVAEFIDQQETLLRLVRIARGAQKLLARTAF